MGPPTADAAAPVEMDPLPTTSPSQQEEPRTVAGAERCSPSIGPESRARSSSHSHPTSSNPKRTPAAEALGTSTDQSISPTPGTSLTIMLLLTTGARHPYTLDEKYVTARQATARTAAGDFDPRELKSYQLKKFIWTDWRQEWEPRPANPSSIRLILMGRMLDDNAALKGGWPGSPSGALPSVALC